MNWRRRKRYTRADQIRDMTDDQLAKVLLSANDSGLSIPFCKDLTECNELLEEDNISDNACQQCMKDWLQQPATTKEVKDDAQKRKV